MHDMPTAATTIACVAFAAGLCGTAHATDAWSPVSTVQLEEMRGGFDAGAGLRMSFGIEREGYINGKLVSATRLTIVDVAHVARLVEEGPANAIPTSLLPGGNAGLSNALKQTQPSAALVIQNTLNRQDIRSLTVINATTNSLELIKGLNLQSTLADALAQSLRSR